MRQRSWQSCRLLLACVFAFAGTAGVSPAQEAPPGKPAAAEQPTAPSAEQILPGEVLPKVYVLKDKDGNLQAMPGFSLEQFMEAWKAKNQIGRQNRPPGYSIQKLTLTGSASRERAELELAYTIAVLEAGWVGVPLRLNDAIVRDPSYDGPGEHILKYDQRDGYVVWIRGEAGKTHQLKLKVLARVIQTGPEARLRLNVARAVESQMRLQIPVERAVATVSEGTTLESARGIEGGKSELTIAGLGGEFEVAWHAAEVQVAALPSALEVTGTMFVRINGRSVNTEAKLVVRSLGGEFDRFQVRLPPGAENIGTLPAGMALVPLDTTSAKGKLYEVKLDKKIVGPLELPLVTERIHDSARADELVELAGFEVLGAVRQSGVIAIKVEGNWQAVWGVTNHVVQVEDPAEIHRRDEPTAGFEYFAQPFSLTAHIVPQRTRVRVQGEYMLAIGSEDAQLSGKLKYTIRGAKVRALEVEMPGWEVDAIGPANLVNVDAAVASQGDLLLIPLLQASSGELELTLEAHAKVSHESGGVQLELPRPRAEVVTPSDVAVVPADNIELSFEGEQTTDLAPQATRPPVKLPERLQDPLFFRTEGPAAKFAASIKVHEQAISASQNTQLDVDETQTQVDQRIAFRIAYEPADHLMLSVPRSIRPDRLSITLDGQRLVVAPTRERAGEQSEMVPMRVALPSPRIGRCELQVRYAVRHEKPANAAKAPVSIPLVIAGEGQVTANDLVVVAKSGVNVSYVAGGPWSEDSQNAQVVDAPALALSARRALGEVALQLSSKERPTSSVTTITRGWIQTRLTDGARQDRAVYRFTTSEPRLQLTLPSGADMGLLELEIDSRRVAPESVNQREVTVSLPGAVGDEHLLELRYRFTDRPPSGSVALAAAQFKSASWVQQFYWQLILPSHEHVLIAPDHFAREFRWGWNNLFWQRVPSWDERDLEIWNGAALSAESGRDADEIPEQNAARSKITTRTTNRYLFSTVGTIEPLEIYTASRARLVFWASLPLLLCGLVLIYFPPARHPAVLYALAIAVAAASFVDPDSALLLAQAAMLGIALAVFAALLARYAARPATPATPVRGSSKALVERGATEIYHRAAHSSQPSTTTDPLMSAASGEAES